MIEPDMVNSMEERVARLERDADVIHLELGVRMAAAGRRMEIDADFTYKVLVLTAMMERMQPLVKRGTILHLAMMNTLMTELAQEHLDGKIGS